MNNSGDVSHPPVSDLLAKEIREKGLLKRINEILKPEGYKLSYKYTSKQDPATDEPVDYLFERSN